MDSQENSRRERPPRPGRSPLLLFLLGLAAGVIALGLLTVFGAIAWIIPVSSTVSTPAGGSGGPIVEVETPVAASPTATTLPPTPTAEAGPPPAVQDALVFLTRQFRVDDPEDVELQSWEAVDWPNTCLGLSIRDTLCAQVITPGYRLLIEVNDRAEFEYRTDQDGLLLLAAAAPPTGIEWPVLVWEGSSPADGICRTLALAPNGEALVGTCGSAQVPLRLFDEANRPAQIEEFLNRFGGFEAETPAGRISLYGTGLESAGPAWQRAVAEWARLAQGELRAGRADGPYHGQALAWQEPAENGCHSLRVDVYGLAFAGTTPCGAIDPSNLEGEWLPAEDLAQLYGWLDGLAGLDRPEPRRLTLAGNGPREASEDEVQAIAAWAEGLYERLAEGP